MGPCHTCTIRKFRVLLCARAPGSVFVWANERERSRFLGVNMKSFTWAAALLFCVGLFGGCSSNKPPAPEPDVMPAPDRIAAAKERLTSQGMMVGTVDA